LLSATNYKKYEPTAVNRGQDQEIVEEAQAGIATKEAQDKYKKSGIQKSRVL
jgi:hypothetical protein